MASVFARVCLVLLLVRSIAESEDGKVSDVTENGEHDVDVEISASGQAKLEKVKFLNSAGIPLDIYWLNPYTQENVIMIPEVMPGQSYEIQTVPGHTFQWMQRGQNSPETVHYRVTIKDLTDVYEVTMAKIWKYASFRCSDRLDSYVCKQKANSGQCERSPGWMIHNCPLACGLCHMRDPFIRCNRTRLRTEKGVWKPGDMNSRFEFITKNFQQYSPKILSHPPEGPWIIQLDDFVNKKEAERLIELNVGRMQRSVDQGSETKEGQVSWKLSEDRTSSSSWCILACERDERVTALRERIEDLTGIPQGYYEGFQVLEYKEGQFYGKHHDDLTFSYTAAGPRILTMFLYLSDVPQGGETDFPDIGVRVTPKIGRAVLWPSRLNDDLLAFENRTWHAALPVISGTKYAANMWIHSHNFKIPNAWGCTGPIL